MFTLRPLAAALTVAAAFAAAPAAAQTHLGTLGSTATGFSAVFLRVFNFTSAPLGAFSDYYTFNLAGPAAAAGGTVSFDWGSLDLRLTSVALSGGTLATPRVDTSPTSFNFNGLGSGSYQLAVNGTLTPERGSFGYASYQGSIHAVASPAPEPEAIALLVAGLGVIGAVARRRNRRA